MTRISTVAPDECGATLRKVRKARPYCTGDGGAVDSAGRRGLTIGSDPKPPRETLKMNKSRFVWTVCLLTLFGPASAECQESYDPAVPIQGTRTFDIGAIAATVLIDAATLGGTELEMVRMVFPPGGPSTGGQHRHGRVEIFYVLSGVLEHEVNGRSHRLEPGMIGIVRPEDTVAHRVLSEEPVRTLVIWAPGGELSRFAGPGDGGP
jgi:quercetin dioxygenase-like cupin family protein